MTERQQNQHQQSNRDTADMMISQMTKMAESCAGLLNDQIQQLKKMPRVKAQGHLIKSSRDGYVRWFRVLTPEESGTGQWERKYLGQKDSKMLQQLGFKLYCNSAICVKEAQLAAVEAYLHKVGSMEKRSARIFQDPDIRKLLGQQQTMTEELRLWQNEEYPRNPQHPETRNVHAAGGLLVRSKSEAIIAAELKKAGIPFRYECEWKYKDITLYPDFMIRHPETGKLYIWEHLGLMDDRAYAANASHKLEIYIRSGLIPSDNLILTAETKEQPLDYNYVQMLIQYHFQMSV